MQDLLNILNQILLPIFVILSPYAVNLLRRWVNTKETINRARLIDTMAEGALGLIMANNPHLDWLDDLDQIKDMLVAALLDSPTVPLGNPEIAMRVAGKAINAAR
jgi:hypothetical protein